MMTSERKQRILDAGSNLSDPMSMYRDGYDAVYPNALKNAHSAEAFEAGVPVWKYKPAVSATAIAHDVALAWVVRRDAAAKRIS